MKTTGYNSVKSWAIAAACSFVSCMEILPIRVSSMFFVAFVSRYNTDRQSATMFIATFTSIRCLAGPPTGYLAEIFGLRSLIIAGCFFSSLGVGFCYFAEDIVTVTISFGVIYGIGLALAVALIPQVIKQHFNKNLANANGISLVGTRFGHFVLIPVISLLLNHYDVAGALLILSGIMLHTVPVAMLLKDPKYKNQSQPPRATEPNREETQQIITSQASKEHNNRDHISTNETTSSSNKTSKNCNELTKYVNENDDATPKTHVRDDFQQVDMTQGSIESQVNGFNYCQQIEATSFSPSAGFKVEQHKKYEFKSFPNVLQEDSVHASSSLRRKQNKYRKALRTLLVLKDPTFLVIMLSQSIQGYIIQFIWTTIIEISRDKDIPHNHEQYLLMFPLVAETAGCTCLGWVTDKGYLSVANYMAISFLLMGFSCFTFVWANNFFTLLTANMSIGLFYAGTTITFPSLIYEFVEERKHTMAIASRWMLYTPLSFTLVPLIGYFRGTLGSYDGALFLLTATCIGCAALLALIPHISKCQKQIKHNGQEINSIV